MKKKKKKKKLYLTPNRQKYNASHIRYKIREEEEEERLLWQINNNTML